MGVMSELKPKLLATLARGIQYNLNDKNIWDMAFRAEADAPVRRRRVPDSSVDW